MTIVDALEAILKHVLAIEVLTQCIGKDGNWCLEGISKATQKFLVLIQEAKVTAEVMAMKEKGETAGDDTETQGAPLLGRPRPFYWNTGGQTMRRIYEREMETR